MADGDVDMTSNFPIDEEVSSEDFAPLETGQSRSLTGKDSPDGVVKKLLVAGSGFKAPEKGDEVTGEQR